MAAENGAFLPFAGISAWFSCSVHPTTIKLWEKYGGVLSGETEASYLFSDEAFTKDTTRLYNGTQEQIVVAKTSWIKEVIRRSCSVHDVVLGRHLLTPHFMAGLDPPNKLQTSKDAGVSGGAKIVQTQYNEVWDKLEEEVYSKSLDSVLQIKLLKYSTGKMPFDFVPSRPEFRVYKKN